MRCRLPGTCHRYAQTPALRLSVVEAPAGLRFDAINPIVGAGGEPVAAAQQRCAQISLF
jgi:hypothetical protein